MSLFSRFKRLTPLFVLFAVSAPLAVTAQDRAPVRIATATRPPSAPSAQPLAQRPDADVTSEQLLDAMNRVRAENGLPPLRIDRRLNLAASDRNRDMADKHYFAHVSPEGVSPFVWFDRRGYHYASAGENLATGYCSAEETVKDWMNSPSHRANLLGDYRDVGIDIVKGSPDTVADGDTIVAVYGTL